LGLVSGEVGGHSSGEDAGQIRECDVCDCDHGVEEASEIIFGQWSGDGIHEGCEADSPIVVINFPEFAFRGVIESVKKLAGVGEKVLVGSDWEQHVNAAHVVISTRAENRDIQILEPEAEGQHVLPLLKIELGVPKDLPHHVKRFRPGLGFREVLRVDFVIHKKHRIRAIWSKTVLPPKEKAETLKIGKAETTDLLIRPPTRPAVYQVEAEASGAGGNAESGRRET